MQHFLLSAAARSLSLKKVFQMGEDVAYQTFCQMRWPETEGEAVCPRCGCTESYSIATRRKFKCVGCYHQYSVTSGTIFASRKLSFTDLLAAIVIFVNGAKGVSALQVTPNPNGAAALRRAAKGNGASVAAIRGNADAFAGDLREVLEDIRAGGAVSLAQVAGELNRRHIRTARGGQWHPSTVRNLLARQAMSC